MNSTKSQTQKTDFPRSWSDTSANTCLNSEMPARRPPPATGTRFVYFCNSASSVFERRPPP